MTGKGEMTACSYVIPSPETHPPRQDDQSDIYRTLEPGYFIDYTEYGISFLCCCIFARYFILPFFQETVTFQVDEHISSLRPKQNVALSFV